MRLTVASGACNRRAPAERLPASTTASSTDIASNRSIPSFHKLRGNLLKSQDTLSVLDILAFMTSGIFPHCHNKEKDIMPDLSRRAFASALPFGLLGED